MFDKLEIFTQEEKEAVAKLITDDKITCQKRNKQIKLTPEEQVRQLYLYRLIHTYNYSLSDIEVETVVDFGREKKRADIIISENSFPYIVIEVKKALEKDGKEQLRSYTNATGAPLAVWTNGQQIEHWHRKDPNYFESLIGIPKAGQTLKEFLDEPFTLVHLMITDKLLNQGTSLKKVIKEMEDEVLANAGVNVFEEGFKLIFTKLFDESQVIQSDKKLITSRARIKETDTHLERIEKLKTIVEDEEVIRDLSPLVFYNYGDDQRLKEDINTLFLSAQEKWKNVFPENSTINLSPSHLAVCVSSLQEIKLFNSNLEVIDEAFEYLINKDSKGEKGQYFTPRHVIDMCVKMLNPHKGESMIDTASGSCGFPVHTWFNMIGHLFDGKEPTTEEKGYVKKIFGLDFDERAVRVARTINLIAGDGETNVVHINTLDFEKTLWDNVNDTEYRDAFKELKKYLVNQKDYQHFKFDLLLANPPFAGEIKEKRILSKYSFYNEKKTKPSSMGRDILFIERNLDFVRDGGRLALVLPQGRFNNTSDSDLRAFIGDRAKILAVVGLHGNTFKPHTGTKTSVLFLQKWSHSAPLTTEEIEEQKIDLRYYCPKVADYNIFFAVSEKAGKDNSGEYVYVKDEDGTERIDQYGHKIKDHDLHCHDGALDTGIAEAFIDYAKDEKFGFVGE